MSFWAVTQELWIDILFIIMKTCDAWPFEAVMNDSNNIMNDIVNDIYEKGHSDYMSKTFTEMLCIKSSYVI